LLGWRWARRTGTPIALRIDGGAEDMPQSPYHRVARPALLRDCGAVLTSGNRGSHYFAANGVARERIFAMPLVPAWDAPAQVPGFADRRFDLLWVGELENSVKNARFFGAVAKALHRLRPQLTLRIIGKGSAQAALLGELAAAGVAYRHEPCLDWREMAAAMTSARLLMLPSTREPWGLVCNEAMQCGTPCLVSDRVGAADELVIDERNGRVLPLEGAGWVEAARTLLTDPDRWTRLAHAARIDVAPRSIDAAASVYRTMVAAALDPERRA
jgi:glycosyltransferase involved in cell wall biosynthesis